MSIGCDDLVKKFDPVNTKTSDSFNSTFFRKTCDGVSNFISTSDFALKLLARNLAAIVSDNRIN